MMNACNSYPCLRTSAGCPVCDPTPATHFPTPFMILASPRTMPVNIPFSHVGITIVTLDGYGNVTIKVDQPYPPADPQ